MRRPRLTLTHTHARWREAQVWKASIDEAISRWMLRLKHTVRGGLVFDSVIPVSRKEALAAGIAPRAFETLNNLQLFAPEEESADKMFALFQVLTLKVVAFLLLHLCARSHFIISASSVLLD